MDGEAVHDVLSRERTYAAAYYYAVELESAESLTSACRDSWRHAPLQLH